MRRFILRVVLSRFSDLVIEQYQNPKIHALLEEMAAREDIPPDVKAAIRYIRSGEGFARKRWDDFDRECSCPPAEFASALTSLHSSSGLPLSRDREGEAL
jgi:hypothetical protein